MPAAITHFLLAQRVLEAVKKQDPSFFVDEDAFYWGAQGPDFLFSNRYLPWQKGESLTNYGEKLHAEKPSLVFEALWEYQRQSAYPQISASYIYGFACHYGADRTCHPFVNGGTALMLPLRPKETESTLHNEIESALDVIILRYEKALLPMEFSIKRTVPKNARVQEEIARMYVFLLNKLYGLNATEPRLLQATNDCRLIFGLVTDRTSFKKSIVERFERKSGCHTISCHIRGISEGDEYDYANVLLNEWHWPLNSQPRSESFFALYENSVQDSIKLIAGMPQGHADFAALTDEIPFC